jgi:hypothetical protein
MSEQCPKNFLTACQTDKLRCNVHASQIYFGLCLLQLTSEPYKINLNVYTVVVLNFMGVKLSS